MKKFAVLVCAALAATFAGATTITNYVVVVSNIYNRISEEHWITNNVKNSHSNYYFTNHTHTVEHETLVVSKTNLTVNADVSQAAIAAARAQADRAEDAVSDASDFASAAAGSASSAASSASSAASSASQAASQRSSAARECASALATINARIAWFDQHSGETITQINITSNNYYAEDSVARSAAQSAAAAAAANASAISTLQGDLSSANGRINNNASAISSLQTGLATANGRIDSNAGAISSLQTGLASSFAYTTAVSNKLEKSSRSRFKIDYVYAVYYRLISGGQYVWSYVGGFKVDPMSARLVSTDSSGTKKYSYSFVNDSSSSYKLTVSAVYKYVPVSGGSYMVVVSDKGTSQNAAISNSGETVLYGSDSRVTVSSDYQFCCDTLGGVYQLEVVKNGVESAGGSLYRPKLKVVLSDEAGAVDQVVLFGDLEAVSNSLASAVSSLRSTVSSHGSSISSLNSSVSSLGSRVTALEAGPGPNEAHVYVHGSTTYSKIHVYDEPVDDGKVYVDGSAVTGYRITPSYRKSTTSDETWIFEPAYCDTDGDGLRLFYLPMDTRPVQHSSSTSSNPKYMIPEYLYWQNGYLYVKIRTYTGGVYDGGYAIARYSDSNYPGSISSSVSMTLVEKSSGWSNNSVANIQSVSKSGSGVPIWFAASASAYQQAVVNWMVSGR